MSSLLWDILFCGEVVAHDALSFIPVCTDGELVFSLLHASKHRHSNRGSLAAQSAHDLYSVCIESVSETDIGESILQLGYSINCMLINALACMQLCVV